MMGDVGQVKAAAQTFGSASSDSSTAARRIRRLEVESWHGPASDGFRGRRETVASELDDHSGDFALASIILAKYAGQMESCDTKMRAARTASDAAMDAWRADPLDLKALGDVLSAREDYSVASDRREQHAIHAADELYALIASDSTDLPGLKWPPTGWPDPASLPTVPLPGGGLGDPPFDPNDVRQGGIGDCYLLASIMALMQTDEGDQLLRDNVRWDADRGGYWVTLYVDGKEVVYFVDRAHQGGASGGSGPNLASIYEAAVAQHLKFADLNDGGWPADALELLTGEDTKIYEDRFLGGYDWDDIRDDLEDGDQLVGATKEGPKKGLWPIEVERRGPDGTMQTEKVDIVGSHAYTIVDVDKNGDVWLTNPWGEGNGADGGGPMKVSEEDFERIFHQIASTGDGK